MLAESRVLKQIEKSPRQSAGYKQLIREMSLRGNERRDLQQMLDSLVRRGKLLETGRDRYTLAQAAANQNIVVGKLTMHRDGYGFVTPDIEEVRRSISGDVYIPPAAIGPAMHGDKVLVELGRRKDEGRVEGRVLKIVDRAHGTVVGTFHYGDRNNYVRPMDEKITVDVIIPRGKEWPAKSEEDEEEAVAGTGRVRSNVDRVLGKEAKRKELDDLEGVVVDVEITEWPTATQNPRGRVVEILGYEDDFGVDVEIIIRKFHIPHRFPTDVLAEAQAFEPVIPARELRHRWDFRKLPIVTIDGETARDFDDAVTVRRLHNGNFELQVHIADVAEYVTDGAALDREAHLRGTSVYFPDRAVPMLPMELSTDICSLRPRVDRLVMSCLMEIDRTGEILGYEIAPGVIRSVERMTYTNVNLILEGDKAVRDQYAHIVDVFELMKEVALLLNAKRKKRGSIDFDLPEPVIEFDENGLMQGVTRSERNIAHRMIEEFMLAANESVASYLETKQIASLYRIHEKPDPKRVLDFETIAATFGYSLGVGALRVQRFTPKADRRERYGTGQKARTVELPEDVPVTPRMYQKLTEKISGKPEERILSFLMLRSLKQARYSEENEGHFALAVGTYTHFTSPIRRYPDLIVHRILKATLDESPERLDGQVHVGEGELTAEQKELKSPWTEAAEKRGTRKTRERGEEHPRLGGPIPEDDLRDIARESSLTERRADEAERELLEWKKFKFMEDRVGEDFDGMIVSITKFGMFVELNELFIEGLIPLNSLTDDHYVFHENTRQIIGQRTRRAFSMGDRVRVILDRVDDMQKRIQFALFVEAPARSKGRRGRR
ncbi:MAG TPA: VacB/RNase II family 3'-5' exoribonuclease [Terriglobales bacterium]|nr:VacB/RNase II family 3'-5' exoribonuclease [Terriglobales bacterium]